MDYGRRDLADRLAADYAIGTLRGPARRRFETLLSAHPVLRDAVAQWQLRLSMLGASVAPVEPPAHVWQRIEERLFAAAARPRLPWWRRLLAWQAFSALASAAVIALVLVQQTPPPAQAPILVVLDANPAVAQPVRSRFVASLAGDGRALALRVIDAPPLNGQQSLELWAVPAVGVPRSLGLVRTDGTTTTLRADLLRGTAAFAVSIEAQGGSVSGLPKGPIVSLGKLQT